jgi:uncharacterized damage-inducible protein DinB
MLDNIPILNPLLETWNIHARIVVYVLNAISSEALLDKGATKGRAVGGMFSHIHAVRLMWLDSAPELKIGLAKIQEEQMGDKTLLKKSLEASARAIEQMIEAGIAKERIKGFKPHPHAFVGYLISHESYHLGEISVALQQSGHPLDKKTAYGMWEWGVR